MDKLENKFIENPLVSTITNEIPIVRAISNYWRESIRQSRDNRLYEFLDDVSTKIENIELEQNVILDRLHLGSKDFLNTIEQVAEIATRTNDNNKVKYLKSFVLNYSLMKRPDINEKDIFLSLIQQLSGTHFLILDTLYNEQKNLTFEDLKSLKTQTEREEIVKLLEVSEKLEIEKELIRIVCITLMNSGLIYISDIYINNPIIVLEPVGLKLLKFLSGT